MVFPISDFWKIEKNANWKSLCIWVYTYCRIRSYTNSLCSVTIWYIMNKIPTFVTNLIFLVHFLLYIAPYTNSVCQFVRAVVVAQLAEQSLPIPEVAVSNPIIGKIYKEHIYCQLYWKDEKEAGIGALKTCLGQKWLIRTCGKKCFLGSGCVAQLIERLLPISEVHGSNPVTGKN